MTMIKINSIKYRHFKGLESFDLDLMGADATVAGANGSGKTTLADGLLWLLFGKDSKGASINPKPLDNVNNEVLGLSPEVEAEMIVDGKVTILKRVQQETWTSKRGELEKTRGADTTKYFIDTVPVKQKEWKDYLAALGDESILQILADSGFFMRLPWKTRREILVNTTDLTDETIINGDPELTELPAILDGHTVDDTRKILASQKREIKNQIDGVPARIQEVTDMKHKHEAAIGDLDREELQMSVLEKQAEISDLEVKLQSLKNGDATLDYQNELAQAQLKLTEAERQYLADSNLQTQSLQEDVLEKQQEVNDLRREKLNCESERYNFATLQGQKLTELDEMKKKRKKVEESTFNEHKKSCPTCGRDLPEDQVTQMASDFNLRKAKWLEEDLTRGKGLKQESQELAANVAEAEAKINEVITKLLAAEHSLDLINNELTQIKSGIKPFVESKRAREIQDEIDLINQKIANATSDTSEAEADLRNQISSLRAEIAESQAKYQSFEQLSSFDERINQLKAEDKRLKDQNQDVERKLWLLDEFTRKKVAALENSINEKFEMIRWKLFNIQKNGALAEVCEATYNGIEYGTSLNTGARINCDLDIVNTLSKELGIKMPIFVDNTESVNQLISIDTQVVELKVGRNKTLKVEV